MTEAQSVETPKRRQASKIGIVTSDKMDKSIVVRVDRTVRHRLYKRYIKRSAQFMVHDESNECKVGDTVEIVETRPLSARKRWRLRRVVRPAGGTAQVASVGQE
jgi:small subunit ribosomal protein S17